MAAKTFDEFVHSTYICKPPIEDFLRECWIAATEAAEEKFTAERTLVGVAPTTAAAAPCHRCKDYELILDVNFCPFCGFEFVRE